MSNKVLVLTSTYPRWVGDTEPPFVHLLNSYLKEDFDIHVLAPHYLGAEEVEVLDGILVRRFKYFFVSGQKLAYEGGILANIKKQPLKFFLVPCFLFCGFISLLSLLRRNEYQLIHAHWIFPQGFLVVLLKLLGLSKAPVLVTSHGGDLFGLDRGIFPLIRSLVLRKAEHVSVVSQVMKDFLQSRHVSSDKISIAPMGVDTGLFRPCPAVPRNQNKVIFCGRLVAKKGVETLLQAFAIVHRKRPDLELDIYGDGPLRERLQHLVNNLGITSGVRFLGAVEQTVLPEAYSSSQIAVMPSVIAEGGDQEGLGLSIIEAIFCGCVPVLSRLPATEDILPKEAEGFFVTPGAIVELAEKIVEVLDDPSMSDDEFAHFVSEVRNRFCWDTSAARYAEIYQRLISAAENS